MLKAEVQETLPMLWNVGKKLANYRTAHDVTIKEMALRTGLSTSLLSQLERGIGNPTISVLAALADGMGISMADLVSEHIENEDLICRRENRDTVRKENGLLLKSVLVENGTNTSLSVHLLELQPQHKSSKGFETHLEEECLYVLEGQLVMVFENEEFLLRDGDSIRVLSNRLHYVRNDGDAPAFALNIKCKIQY